MNNSDQYEDFIAVGTVEPFIRGRQYNLRLNNLKEAEEWYARTGRTTRLYWTDPRITISARRFVDTCQPGDVVEYRIRATDRANGRRGIRGIECERLVGSVGTGATGLAGA